MCVHKCTSHARAGHIVLTGSNKAFERKASIVSSYNIFVINSDLHMMSDCEFLECTNTTKAFFEEAARVLEVDHVTPVNSLTPLTNPG